MIIRIFILCAALFVSRPCSLFGADTITGLAFSRDSDLSETVLLRGSGRLFPDIAVLNNDSPRIVYDFIGARKAPEIKDIPGGRFVRAVRIGIHRQPVRKVRMVLDMEPKQSYTVNHFFDEKNGLFRVDVRFAETPVPAGKTMAVAFSHETPAIPEKKPATKPAVATAPPARPAADATTPPAAAKPKTATPAPVATEKSKNTPPPAAAKTAAAPDKAAPTAAVEEKHPAANRRQPARIDHIRISHSEAGKETVLFTMKGFSPPRIRAVEDKDHVRLLCDFDATGFHEGLTAEIRGIAGELVRRILVAAGEKDKQDTRVTIELSRERSYKVQQFFFKEENLFAVVIQDMEAKAQP